jgi:acyl transferase domain-containing protein
MTKEVKFTDEELQQLQAIQSSYQNIQTGFGQLKVQRLLLEQQLNSLEEAEVNLESEYEKAQTNERTFVKSLNEKYGPGSLNPETGVFTPTETTTETTTGAPK